MIRIGVKLKPYEIQVERNVSLASFVTTIDTNNLEEFPMLLDVHAFRLESPTSIFTTVVCCFAKTVESYEVLVLFMSPCSLVQ